MPTLTRQVVAGADDALAYSLNTYYNNHPAFSAGNLYSGGIYYYFSSCARFTNITIPQGATILSAKIRLKGLDSLSGTTCRTSLGFHNVDDATAPANYSDFYAWYNNLAGSAEWTIPAINSETWYDSPDIAGLVQNIINRAGWVSGNDVLLFFRNNGSDAGAYRTFKSYNSSPTDAPELVIEYTSAYNTTVTVTAAGAATAGTTAPSITTDSNISVPAAGAAVAAITYPSVFVINFDSIVRQPLARATIQYGNPAFDTSISPDSPTGGDYFGTFMQAVDGVFEPSGRFQIVGEVEVGDDSIPNDPSLQIGWIAGYPTDASSVPQSGGHGALNFKISFTNRTIQKFKVYADEARGAYPVDFTVQVIFGADLTRQFQVTGNTNPKYEGTFSTPVDDAYTLSLIILKWSIPYDYPRILEFGFDNYESMPMTSIKSISNLRERRVEGQGVPYGTQAAWELQMEFERNPDRVESEYRTNVPISVELGTKAGGVESYVPAGLFYAYKWNLDDAKIASVIAHDWRRILSDDDYFYQSFTNTKSIKQLINELLNASRVPAGLWRCYNLNYVPQFVIFQGTKQLQALNELLAADLGVAEMDVNGICVFKEDEFYSSSKTLTASTHIMKPLTNQADTGPMATVVEVTYYTYAIDVASSNIIEAAEDITLLPGDYITVTLKWSNSEIVAITGWSAVITKTGAGSAEVFMIDYVNGGIELGIENLSGTDSATITKITITGKAVRAAKHVYVVEHSTAINKYGRIVYSFNSMLIQSLAQAQRVGNALIEKYNTPNKVWKWNSPGDPQIVPGDVVNIPGIGGDAVDVQVERQHITFGVYRPGLREEITARTQ